MPQKNSKKLQPVQLTFDDARKPDGRHGGWRPGAGRPAGRNTVTHDAREDFPARYPVLATWRLQPDLPSLRQPRIARIIFDGIRAVHSTSFRVTDFSIQGNHLHFINEADGAEALADGMQVLAGFIVQPINRAMSRNGKLFETRYHSRPLGTPREVKNALRYVINNVRKHAAERNCTFPEDWIDPYSSASWFDGWRQPLADHQVAPRRATAQPHTWLRNLGWRRWGLLDFDEIPRGE